MRSRILAVSSILLGFMAIYLVTVAIVGNRVASELDRYEAVLIARDDVRVIRFDYERGFWGGQLFYEFNVLPGQTNELGEDLVELFGLSGRGFDLAGNFDVQHGPWFGKAGFGLAKADLSVQLPDQFRDALPQYPGQTPMMELKGILTFAGTLHTDVSVIDYDGLVVVNNESADLQIIGLTGSFESNSQLNPLKVELSLRRAAFSLPDYFQLSLEDIRYRSELEIEHTTWHSEFSSYIGRIGIEHPSSESSLENFTASGIFAGNGQLQEILHSGLSVLTTMQLDIRLDEVDVALLDEIEPGIFQLNGLSMQFDFSEDTSTAMMGSSRFELNEFTVYIPSDNIQFSIDSYSATGLVERVGNTVESEGYFGIRQLSLNNQLIGGMALESSLRGINIDSYAAFDRIAWSSAYLDHTQDEDALLEAIQKLARDQITFNVDRLAFFLPNEEDVTATLSIKYEGSPQIDTDSLDQLVEATSLEASLRATISAIDLALANAGLSTDQQEQIQVYLQDFYQLPYFTVGNNTVSSSLQLQRGEVLVNGEPFARASDLTGLASELGTGAL